MNDTYTTPDHIIDYACGSGAVLKSVYDDVIANPAFMPPDDRVCECKGEGWTYIDGERTVCVCSEPTIGDDD